MREESSGRRPSVLSGVFRRHASPGGRLAEWTRQVDGDWMLYCPLCTEIVVLIEEKLPTAREQGWSATRRLATLHPDAPWGWRVTSGAKEFTVIGARGGEGHKSFGDTIVDEDGLIRMIEKAFTGHWDARHGGRR